MTSEDLIDFERAIDAQGHNVFFFWDDPSRLPEVYEPNIQRVKDLHPTWSVHVVGDAIIQALMDKHQPEIAKIYSLIRIPACRSDIARQLLLSLYGGWYLDCDLRCREPLSKFGQDRPAFILRDDTPGMQSRFRVTNMVLFNPKGHRLPRRMLRGIVRNLQKPKMMHDVLGLAGPKLLSRVVAQYDPAKINLLSAAEHLNADTGMFTETTSNTSFSWRIQQPFGILPVDEPAWSTFPHRLRKVHVHALRTYLDQYDLHHHLPKLAEMRPRFLENETFQNMLQDYAAAQPK